MAISATFVARFDSFFEQVNKAESHLGELTSSSESVQKSIDRLAKSFSGDKIIQDATLTAKAIEDIGGASMLTEKEAARVNRTMTEALEKMQRLGVDVPPGIKKLADETANAGNKTTIFGQVTSSVTDLAKKAALAFGAMFAAEQILSFAKHIISVGGELTDLSTKTGVSTTALQQFKYAGGQVGVELDAITGGINQMQKRLAGDDKSAINAIKSLGLEMGAFRSMKPEQQFAVLADKIGSIEDPMMRTKAATDLFGKSGAELLPALTKEFGALTEKANTLGIVMDEQTVASMDALGDTVTDLGSVAMASLGRIIQPLVPLLSGLATIAMRLADVLGTVLGFAVDKVTQAFKWLGNAALDMTRSLLIGLQMTADAVPGLNKLTGASDALGWAISKIDAAQKSLNTTQPETIKQAKQAGLEFEVASKSTDKAADATRKLVDQLTGRKAAEEMAAMAEAIKKAGGESKITASELERVAKQTDAWIKEGVKVDPVLGSIWLKQQQFNTGAALTVDQLNKMVGSTQKATKELENFLPPLQAISIVSMDKILGFSPAVSARIKADAEKAAKQASEGFVTHFGEFAKTELPKSIMAAIQGGGDVLESVGSSIGSFLTGPQGFGKQIDKGLKSVFGDAFGSALSSLIPGLGAMLGPLLSAIGGKVAGMFGAVSKEVKEARANINELETSLAASLTAAQKVEAGGVGWKMTTIAVRDAYLAVGRTAAEAEAIVRQLWDDKNPNRVKAAIEEITRVLNQQKKDQEDLNAAIERYGFTIEQLGPTMQRQKLSEMAQQLERDFVLLTRSGIDVTIVTEKMADKLNEYVATAFRTGQDVPSAMRPILEQMVKQGLLTDENGNKLEDLSSIKFSETLSEGFTRVVDAVERLTRAITGGIEQSASAVVDFAQSASDAVGRIPTKLTFTVSGTTDSGSTIEHSYAAGTRSAGRWFRNFGAGTAAVLHGDEAVVRRDQSAAFAAEVGGGADPSMLDELRNLRGDMMALPQHLARAVRDAILVAG
jgi:anti-sigma factor ChrR (cupin superfamily)